MGQRHSSGRGSIDASSISPAPSSIRNNTDNNNNNNNNNAAGKVMDAPATTLTSASTQSRRDFLKHTFNRKDESQTTLASEATTTNSSFHGGMEVVDFSNSSSCVDFSTSSCPAQFRIQEVAPHQHPSYQSSSSSSSTLRRRNFKRSQSWTSKSHSRRHAKEEEEDDDDIEEFYLKNRRPTRKNGLEWHEDPTGQTWLHHGRNWPRDYATIRGRVVTVQQKQWLLATRVRQVNDTKWHKAPAGAALPFFHSNSYCLVPTANNTKRKSRSSIRLEDFSESSCSSLGGTGGGNSNGAMFLPPNRLSTRRLQRQALAQQSSGSRLWKENEPPRSRQPTPPPPPDGGDSSTTSSVGKNVTFAPEVEEST